MPIDPEQLLIFLPAALALNLTPGNDMVFSLNQGLIHGPAAGVAASLGVATGSFIHSVIAAIGLAAIVSTTPFLFQTIRWAGIAYLVYIAFKTLATQRSASDLGITQSVNGQVKSNSEQPMRILRTAWLQGTLVNLTNPKVALFILAFVPQFVDPERGSAAAQFLIYGLLMNIGGTIINGTVGYFAGQFSATLQDNPVYIKVLGYVTSVIFLALAVRLALL